MGGLRGEKFDCLKGKGRNPKTPAMCGPAKDRKSKDHLENTRKSVFCQKG